MPILPINAVITAKTGGKVAAITGSITISRVMNDGPPMKGVSGKKVEIMKRVAKVEASVSLRVFAAFRALKWSSIFPPYSGIFRILAQRVGGPTHAPLRPIARIVNNDFIGSREEIIHITGSYNFRDRIFPEKERSMLVCEYWIGVV